MTKQPLFLCNTHEIDGTLGKRFNIEDIPLFVVSENDTYHAYINRCPHQNIALDWDNEHFLDTDRELIVCASHGAQFLVNSGLCVAGPCAGKSLTKLPLEVYEQKIYLQT